MTAKQNNAPSVQCDHVPVAVRRAPHPTSDLLEVEICQCWHCGEVFTRNAPKPSGYAEAK